MLDLTTLRQNYTRAALDIQDVSACPLKQFHQWMQEAIQCEILEPNAMTLSTVCPQTLMPNSRTVLLKEVSTDGFIFFTNYQSQKGLEISSNPKVSLLFTWLPLERQIHIQGHVTKIPAEQSASYFHSRPRASQLGAWASAQSQVISDRAVLEKNYQQYEQAYPDAVPYPSHWGGYLVTPVRIEFWQGRASRLHDRLRYTRSENQHPWHIERISP